MKVLIDGCVAKKNQTSEGDDVKVKIVEPDCFLKALKFSQVFSNYDQEKFTECISEQMKDIDAH